MSYQIRKIQPAHRPQKPRWRLSKQHDARSLAKQLSSASTSINDSPERTKPKSKASIQTIMMAKSSYAEKLNITSTSWCLYDSHSGRHIGFREKTQREIASLTKVMTTLLAIEIFEALEISKDLLVRVTEQASKLIGTSAQLKPRVWVGAWDLLYGAMLPSGNDAAHLLSEVLGYMIRASAESVKSLKCLDLTKQNTTPFTVEFIKLMNRKAEELSLRSTTFSNPHGLQNAMNQSSPRDMIALCEYATKNDTFRSVMNSEYYRYYYWEEKPEAPKEISAEQRIKNHSRSTRRSWWNTNLLLKKGWEGVKTGQTGAAGSCLASLRKGIFIVVLNCKDNEARFSQTEKIYDWYEAMKAQQEAEETQTVSGDSGDTL